MNTYDNNPFSTDDTDRYQIWEMLVRRDIDAFLASDWAQVQQDFIEGSFFGINARFRANPDSWRLSFGSVADYASSWLKQSSAFRGRKFKVDPRQSLFEATTLRDIEISGDKALLHKKFDGYLEPEEGNVEPLLWQTLYQCEKDTAGEWKIVGFVGYLPNPMPTTPPAIPSDTIRKRIPAGAHQHTTAGPYSPVLEIESDRIVVISGQAAIDPDGNVIGESIEEQTRYTIKKCEQQLATAGCTLADVFKVNAFLVDLDEWPRFNAIYQEMIPEPRPVRTAVGTSLLMTLKVELEMWAVSPSKR